MEVEANKTWEEKEAGDDHNVDDDDDGDDVQNVNAKIRSRAAIH